MKEQVDIAKESKLVSINEIGFVIRNPVSLAKGLIGRFYFKLLDDGQDVIVYGKAVSSVVNPEKNQEVLVTFVYFSISSRSLLEVRRYLATRQSFRTQKSEGKSNFLYDPEAEDLTDRQRIERVVGVVTPNPEDLEKIQEFLSNNFDHLKIVTAPSLLLLYQEYFEVDERRANSKPLPAEAIVGDEFYFVIQKLTWKVSSTSPADKEDEFLGRPINGLKVDDKWLELFDEKKTRPGVRQFLTSVMKESGMMICLIDDNAGNSFAVKLEASLMDEDRIKIQVSPPSKPEFDEFVRPKEKCGRLDAVVCESNTIDGELQEWFDEQDAYLRENKVNQDPAGFGVLILDDQNTPKYLGEDLKPARVWGHYMRPLESRSIAAALSLRLKHTFNSFVPENLNWAEPFVDVDVAKSVTIVKLSEYGATIRHDRTISPGTFLKFRGDLVQRVFEEPVVGRFYAYEDDPDEAGYLLCHILFYGLAEAKLKALRQYFIEYNNEHSSDD